jgi:chaperonin GroES
MTSRNAASLNVTPLADRVVIRGIDDAEHVRGGLYIPDTAREKPRRGEVVAVGSGRTENGRRIPMEISLGDRVLYEKLSGIEVVVDGETVLILRESDVLAIVP